MALYQGRLASVGIGKESTAGTAVAATTTLPVRSSAVAETATYEEADELHHGAGGVAARRVELARDVGGSLSLLAAYSGGIGLLLEGALGAVNTTGSGPYAHAFSLVDPASLPAYTVIGRWGSSSYLSTCAGCKINRLMLSIQARKQATVDVDWLGMTRDSFASGSPGTPTLGNLILPHHAGTLDWNSVSYSTVQKMDLEIDNALTRMPYLGSLVSAAAQPNGRRTVKLSVDVQLTDAQLATLLSSCRSGTQSDLDITFTGSGNESLVVQVQNAQIVETPVANPSALGPLITRLVFAGTWASSFDGLTVTLNNDQSSYAA